MWLNMSQMLLARRLYCDFLPIFIKRCDGCGSSSNLELISTQEVKIDSYSIHEKLLLMICQTYTAYNHQRPAQSRSTLWPSC